MNRLDAMNTFVHVAELGSFAAAAAKLGVARSVVTRQVAALEDHLHVKLIIRTTRRLTLTSTGSSYLEQCRKILELIETTETQITQDRLTPRGHLRIGVPLSFGLKKLVPLLLEFCAAYPEISLNTDFTDHRQHLIAEGLDLGIRISARLDPSDIARKLGSSRLLTLASPDYLAHYGCPQHPDELAAHTCLGYVQQGHTRPWEFCVEGRSQHLYLPFRLQANNGEALAEAAARGLGITVTPDFVAQDYLAAGRLVTILEAFAPPDLGIFALLPSARYIPQRVRVLITFLSTRI